MEEVMEDNAIVWRGVLDSSHSFGEITLVMETGDKHRIYVIPHDLSPCL